MQQYLALLKHVLTKGHTKGTISNIDIKSTFGYQMRFDLRHGFPIITTKKMPFKIMANELLWFISGQTNIKYLQEHKIHYWDDFADSNGELGPVYGAQWRAWPTGQVDKHGQPILIDQLTNVIEEIKTQPNSKAMIVTAWNPTQVPLMRLPPCHMMFQFNVTKGKLRLQMYQRSADVFLGVPFNITQYALLLMMVAQVTGLEARELIHTIGDAHLYKNHLTQAEAQLQRQPKPLPRLKLNPQIKNIDDFTIDDIELVNYQAHPHIQADLVVVGTDKIWSSKKNIKQ